MLPQPLTTVSLGNSLPLLLWGKPLYFSVQALSKDTQAWRKQGRTQQLPLYNSTGSPGPLQDFTRRIHTILSFMPLLGHALGQASYFTTFLFPQPPECLC